jgi:tetratricopeptide (TPR) repeat protein
LRKIAKALCDLARKCVTAKIYGLAKEIMKTLSSIPHDDLDIEAEIAEFYLSEKEFGIGIPIAKQVLEKGYEEPHLVINLAKAFLALHDLPNNQQILAELALRREDIFFQAEKVIKDGLALHSHNWELWRYLGKILLLQRELQQAKDAYQKAMFLRPNDPEPVIAMIEDMKNTNYEEEAEREAAQALKQFPNNEKIFELWIRLKLIHGKTKEVMSILSEKSKKDPKNPLYIRLLGLTYLHLHDTKKAQQCLKMLNDLAPSDEESQRLLKDALKIVHN